jgi:hypothetical protein
MAHTAIATLQPAADCRWYRSWIDIGDAGAPHTARCVCVREGTPRAIDLSMCETCPHWEAAPHGSAAAVVAAGALARPRVGTAALLRAMTRTVLVLTAVLFAALGVTMLTSPWAIPVTMTFWLSAAAIGAFGLFGRLPEN